MAPTQVIINVLAAAPTSLTTPTPAATLELPDLFVNDDKLNPANTGLLPRANVREAREKYFETLACTGILKSGTAPVESIFDSAKDSADYPGTGTGRDGTGNAHIDNSMNLAHKAHGEKWYAETFAKHPNTWSLERTILRNNVPGNKAIGVHYDLISLRHGDDSALTAWIPMGDIKIQGGGLIYLEQGHVLGKQIEHGFTEKAKASGLTDEEAKFAFNQNMMAGGHLAHNPKEFGDAHQRRWLVTGYEAGDVVIHDSYMIHASTMNNDEDGVIRLGTDLGFVNRAQQYHTGWDKVYTERDGL